MRQTCAGAVRVYNVVVMFKRLAICLVLVGAPHVAAAQSVQEQIVGQLRAQGFTEISLNRTWLGRVRVVALRDGLRRELVFNPQTGEILRDYWADLDDTKPRLFNPGGGSSSGGGINDDDEDDDDEDDDDEDDDDEDDDDDDDEDDDDDDDDEDD